MGSIAYRWHVTHLISKPVLARGSASRAFTTTTFEGFTVVCVRGLVGFKSNYSSESSSPTFLPNFSILGSNIESHIFVPLLCIAVLNWKVQPPSTFISILLMTSTSDFLTAGVYLLSDLGNCLPLLIYSYSWSGWAVIVLPHVLPLSIYP